jgi:hypothetical protein
MTTPSVKKFSLDELEYWMDIFMEEMFRRIKAKDDLFGNLAGLFRRLKFEELVKVRQLIDATIAEREEIVLPRSEIWK